LGPYEIVAQIGAGGMGEVYRARDTHLKRDVAVKVLPEEVANNRERESRFLQEARAAGALNHPNIVAVYDVSRQNGVSYIVSELVEGESLRAVMAHGPLTPRRCASLAAQMAQGLAAAHSSGIVHRDLKPENILCTSDGRVKILDFGLAKHTLPKAAANSADVTLTVQTNPGVIMGTVGYMSPEQVRGQVVDSRSDIFSLGVILYEMLTGQRAFGGTSSVDTLSAILKEDPPPLDPAIPSALSQVVQRCLEKEPARRFQNAGDLAFALQTLSSVSAGSPISPPLRKSSRRVLFAVAGVALVAAGIAAWLARVPAPVPLGFEQLTFRDGFVARALFQPDGGFTYTATWTGTAQQTYTGRLGDREHRALPLVDHASLAAISPTGELAIRIGNDLTMSSPYATQLLARAPGVGGPHRDIAEDVVAADWAPDGSAMAVVRRVNNLIRLEYPIGHVLDGGQGFQPRSIRISPNGQRLAASSLRVGASFNGEVGVFDRSGRYTVVYRSPVGSVLRSAPICWSPDGKELWFTSLEARYAGIVFAATLQGRVRKLIELPGAATLEDVSPDDRLLVTLGTNRADIAIQDRAGSHNLPWLGYSRFPMLTRDLRNFIFSEEQLQQFGAAIYRRSLDGSPAVKLSDGHALAVSPSGSYVIAWRPGADPAYWIVPTGAGQERPLRVPGYELGPGAPLAWLPDEKNLVIWAREAGHDGRRLIVYNIDSAVVQTFTRDLRLDPLARLPIVPDGSAVFTSVDGHWLRFPLNGRPAAPVKGLEPGEYIVQCASDGKHIYVGRQAPEGDYRIFKVDPETGERALLAETSGQGPANFDAAVSADGTTVAYPSVTRRSTLYLLTGIR